MRRWDTRDPGDPRGAPEPADPHLPRRISAAHDVRRRRRAGRLRRPRPRAADRADRGRQGQGLRQGARDPRSPAAGDAQRLSPRLAHGRHASRSSTASWRAASWSTRRFARRCCRSSPAPKSRSPTRCARPAWRRAQAARLTHVAGACGGADCRSAVNDGGAGHPLRRIHQTREETMSVLTADGAVLPAGRRHAGPCRRQCPAGRPARAASGHAQADAAPRHRGHRDVLRRLHGAGDRLRDAAAGVRMEAHADRGRHDHLGRLCRPALRRRDLRIARREVSAA